MKRILMLFLVTLLIFTMVACNNDESASKVDDKQTSNDVVKQEDKTDNQEDKKEENKVEEVDFFAKFEKNLDSKSISYEKVEKVATMIGAIEGCGYKLGDERSIEIYKFDDSKKLEEIKKDNSLKLEGFDMTLNVSAINNSYILIQSNNATDDISDIIEIFNK